MHAPPHREGQYAPGNAFTSEVKITLKDGSSFSSRVMRPLGRSVSNPIPPLQLKVKFEDCASSVLPAQQVTAVSQALDQFESLASVRDFMRLPEVPVQPRAQRKSA